MAGRWGTKVCKETKPLDKQQILKQLEEDPNAWRQTNLENAYLTQDNYDRRCRAEKLAKEMGVELCQISLAWVLAKHPRTFALVGTTNPVNWNKNVSAAGIHLTPEQVSWLESGEPISK